MPRSFFSKSVSLCLWAVRPFVPVFRLHLEVMPYGASLSLSLVLLLEQSSLPSFLTLDLACIPPPLWFIPFFRIPLCTCAPLCIPSPALLRLTCLFVLAVVHSGAKISGLPISIKILVVSTHLPQPQMSPDMRHKLAEAPEWENSPSQGAGRE